MFEGGFMVTEPERHQLYERLNDVLGEEGAGTLMAMLPRQPVEELATRADLAELESRLETRIERSRSEMQAGFATIEVRFSEMETRFAHIDQRFAHIDQRFAHIDQRFAHIDQRFAEMYSLFAGLESKFADLESRFAGLESRFAGLESRFAELESSMGKFHWKMWLMILTNIATAAAVASAIVGVAKFL